MYQVTFYSFPKKPNSTARPTEIGVTYTCKLVDPSGILAPVIELKLPDTTDPSVWNYAYISSWQRYYYVRDWFYNAGIWTAQLQVDSLASWKTEIGSQSAYVARSSYAMNGRIADSSYPIIAGNTTSTATQASNPFAESYANGWFIIGILNSDTYSIGGVSYYAMTNAQFQTFRSLIFGDISWAGVITDVTASMAKLIANPLQYIASITWVPFNPGVSTTVASIPFGYWSVSCSAYRVTYPRAGGTVTISVPKHPLALTRGYYLLVDPYSSYYLDFPPFGSMTIPAECLVDSDLISFSWDCDIITGKGRLCMANDQGQVFNIVQGQVGIPVQIASSAPDVSGIVNQLGQSLHLSSFDTSSTADTRPEITGSIGERLVATAQAAIYDLQHDPLINKVATTISGTGEKKSFASNIINAVMQKLYPAQSIGSNGGFMAGYYPIRLIGQFARIADDDNNDRGRPLCEVKRIDQIPGFIQLAEAHLRIPGTLSEMEEINTAAAAGFFWE